MFFVGFSCRSGGVFATKTDTNLGTKSPNEGSWSPCLSGVSWTLCATLTLDPFRLLSKHEKVAISCNTCQHCLSKICTFPITSRTNVTTCWLVDYFPLPAKDTIRDQIEIKKKTIPPPQAFASATYPTSHAIYFRKCFPRFIEISYDKTSTPKLLGSPTCLSGSWAFPLHPPP